MKVPHTLYRVPSFYGDSNWHTSNLESTSPLSIVNPIHYVEAYLNGQWGISQGDSIPSPGEGYIVLRSESNYHIASQSAVMYVKFKPEFSGSMTFKILNSAESGYDYPIVTLEDGTTLYSDRYSTGTFNSFTVTLTGEHTMTVTFRKDGSGDSNLDRAFLAVPLEVSIIDS